MRQGRRETSAGAYVRGGRTERTKPPECLVSSGLERPNGAAKTPDETPGGGTKPSYIALHRLPPLNSIVTHEAHMARSRNAQPIPPPPSKLAREARVEQLLATGHRTNAVCRIAAEEYGVTKDTVMGDVAVIRDRWAAESAASRPAKRAELEAQADELFRRCMESGDHKGAAMALQLKADLHGARMRPMAAIVQPGAAPASLDAWLSAQLGHGAPVQGEGLPVAPPSRSLALAVLRTTEPDCARPGMQAVEVLEGGPLRARRAIELAGFVLEAGSFSPRVHVGGA